MTVAPQEAGAKRIDGKAISADIREELKQKVEKLQEKFGKVRPPLLSCSCCKGQISTSGTLESMRN